MLWLHLLRIIIRKKILLCYSPCSLSLSLWCIHSDDRVSMATVVLIKEMMEVDTKKRITARRALEITRSLLSRV